MNLPNVIMDIRKKFNLTQEELADRLFVTRQAVSRWETGDTTPALETLKKISELFNLDANYLLGVTEPPICQSCSMTLTRLEDFGTNADKTANVEYCHYCFQDGKFTHERTIDEMIETNLRFLDEFNAENGTAYTEDEAKKILKLHLSTLKRWQKAN